MSIDSIASVRRREASHAHIMAAHWGRGVGTLWRITRMTLRHPWQVAIAIVSTFVAAVLQLFIPRLLGQAVDQARGVGPPPRRRWPTPRERCSPRHWCCWR